MDHCHWLHNKLNQEPASATGTVCLSTCADPFESSIDEHQNAMLGSQMLANASVPLLWDHLDQWDGFPFWDLSSWELKYTFAGVFTAGRVAKMAFDRAGIPAHFVYHSHNNYVRCSRPSRRLMPSRTRQQSLRLGRSERQIWVL